MILHIIIILFALLALFIYFRMQCGHREFFDESSSSDIDSGASTYYNFGNDSTSSLSPPSIHKHKSRCPKCEFTFMDNITCDIPAQVSSCKSRHRGRNNCRNCDITRHPDIDKYVLKSSVPPCPNMSNYATKAMLPACPDMRDYVHKSQIPDCSVSNNTNYISKEHCEKYKRSLFTDIEDWIRSFFGTSHSHEHGHGHHSRGMRSHSYGWGAGYSTANSGYGLNGGDVSSSSNANDGITINAGQATAQNAAQQQKDQQDEANYMQGWSNSTLGSGVYLGNPSV